MKFFAPNLERRGRILRTIVGILLLTAGLVPSRAPGWFATMLVITGGFVLYEGLRGWCLMKACSLRKEP